jgi:hypothetical protein
MIYNFVIILLLILILNLLNNVDEKFSNNYNIIIVGNSIKNIETKNEVGYKIDKFKKIVRFNNYKLTSSLNKYLGTKTHIHCFGSTIVQRPIFHESVKFKHIIKLLIDNGRPQCSCRDKSKLLSKYKDIKIEGCIPFIFLEKMRKKYKYKTTHFSSGLSVILYYLFYKNEQFVYITNFDNCLEYKKTHYFDNEKSRTHNWQQEKKIIDILVLQKKIKIL